MLWLIGWLICAVVAYGLAKNYYLRSYQALEAAGREREKILEYPSKTLSPETFDLLKQRFLPSADDDFYFDGLKEFYCWGYAMLSPVSTAFLIVNHCNDNLRPGLCYRMPKEYHKTYQRRS